MSSLVVLTYYSSYVPTTEACWYRVYSTAESSTVNRIQITMESATGGTPEVYTESNNYYTYQGTLSSGTKTYSIGKGDSVYVVFKPTSSTSTGFIYFTAAGAYYWTSTTLNVAAIIAIVAGGVCYLVIGAIAVIVIVCILRRRKKEYPAQSGSPTPIQLPGRPEVDQERNQVYQNKTPGQPPKAQPYQMNETVNPLANNESPRYNKKGSNNQP